MTDSEQTRLESDLEQVQEEVKRLSRRLEQRPDLGHGRGSARAYAWEMALARKQKAEARVTDLHRALHRLREGEYGLCRRCGACIDPDRLEILPTTTLCVACARIREGNGAGRMVVARDTIGK